MFEHIINIIIRYGMTVWTNCGLEEARWAMADKISHLLALWGRIGIYDEATWSAIIEQDLYNASSNPWRWRHDRRGGNGGKLVTMKEVITSYIADEPIDVLEASLEDWDDEAIEATEA